MNSDVAVSIRSVKKLFKPPTQSGSFKAMFTSVLTKKKSKSQKAHKVLNGIDLDIKRGEFFGIVGRNGSGKSTLLKILAGIYQPTSGEVSVRGRLVPFIELGVGFNPELTGRDNVYLNGAILGFSKKEIDAMYASIVDFAELGEFMDEKLKNYSSGMQVRLAFSMAVRADADILLIDEVLAVGDASFQKKCYDYFFELKKAKKTVIFISHDMDAVRTYCDRVMVLDAGYEQYTGTVAEATERYFRLFQDKSTKGEDQFKQLKRWGDGTVKFDSYIHQHKGGKTTIKTTLDVLKETSVLNIGISVKDPDMGEIIFGTNTEYSATPLRDLHKGQKITVEWEFPDVLRDGTYSVDLAAHGRGGLPVYDWINDALLLHYANGRKTPYVVSPEVKISVSK